MKTRGQRFYHDYGFDMAGFEGREQVGSALAGFSPLASRQFRAEDTGAHAPAPANFGGEPAVPGSFPALAVWQLESL